MQHPDWTSFFDRDPDNIALSALPLTNIVPVTSPATNNDDAALTRDLLSQQSLVFFGFSAPLNEPTLLTNIRRRGVGVVPGAQNHYDALVIPPRGRNVTTARLNLPDLIATCNFNGPSWDALVAASIGADLAGVDTQTAVSIRSLIAIPPRMASVVLGLLDRGEHTDDPHAFIKASIAKVEVLPEDTVGPPNLIHPQAASDLLHLAWGVSRAAAGTVQHIQCGIEHSVMETNRDRQCTRGRLGEEVSAAGLAGGAAAPLGLLPAGVGVPQVLGDGFRDLSQSLHVLNQNVITAEANRARDREARNSKSSATGWPDWMKSMVLFAMTSGNLDDVPEAMTTHFSQLCRCTSVATKHTVLEQGLMNEFGANVAVASGIAVAITCGNILWKNEMHPCNLTVFGVPMPTGDIHGTTFDAKLALTAQDPSLRNVSNNEMNKLTKQYFVAPDHLDGVKGQLENFRALIQFMFGRGAALSGFVTRWIDFIRRQYQLLVTIRTTDPLFYKKLLFHIDLQVYRFLQNCARAPEFPLVSFAILDTEEAFNRITSGQFYMFLPPVLANATSGNQRKRKTDDNSKTVKNHQRNPDCWAITKIGSWRQNVIPNLADAPKNSGGTSVCLNYHIKGECSSSCQRAATHGSLSPDIKKAMDAFIKTCTKTS